MVVGSSALAVGCGFDSGGIATGSSASGVLDSTGSGTGDQGMTMTSADPVTTAAATSADQTTTPSETTDDEASGTPPSTTDAPSDSSGTSDVTVTGGTTDSGGPEESSSSGATVPVDDGTYYRDCSVRSQAQDCGAEPNHCHLFALDDLSTGEVCHISCDQGPCPLPSTGNATPLCDMDNFCVLDCAGDLQCPDGMLCDYSFSFEGYRCVWQ